MPTISALRCSRPAAGAVDVTAMLVQDSELSLKVSQTEPAWGCIPERLRSMDASQLEVLVSAH